ncbi:unnamed protein product [Adineta steineri]|nr:unnamed protein product [Adineta steineri]
MNVARKHHTASTLANGYVLVTGGLSDSATLNSAELYNPSTGTWTMTGNMSVPRACHTASTLKNGDVLVTGGINGVHMKCAPNSIALKIAELYNSLRGTWTITRNMNVVRKYHTALTLANGYVLVAGGYFSNGLNFVALNSTELYNPLRGTWTTMGSMNVARVFYTAATLANGSVLVAGGYFSNGLHFPELNSTELYNPLRGTWAMTGNMNVGRKYHTASTLANGSVLVTGGLRGSAALRSAELYNPSTGTWTTTRNMDITRFFHTASTLADGSVLVAGGEIFHDYLDRAEFYNPLTDTWTTTGLMNVERKYHTASTLANGLVLVTGGENSAGALNSAEFY